MSLPSINGQNTLSSGKKNDDDVKEIIEDEKPRLENVLREVRDRAKDVRDKVAVLARRAAEEASEVRDVEHSGSRKVIASIAT